MTERTFEPARLRLARELKAWSQTELSRKLGITSAALSQFESGAAGPSRQTRERLADILGVPVAFFELPLVDTHEGFFRSLRRTAVADRRRARAIAHVAHDLATHGDVADHLPVPSVPHYPLTDLDADPRDAEGIAARVRREWGIPSGPAPDLVNLLESHGVVVMRLPLGSADVDAFSLPFADRPVVVLGSDKNDRARSRFDAAHELGHLVMHGEQVWGVPQVEKQAHCFAAAFLMPQDDIYSQLPERADWPLLFELKRSWQVSLAALLMRAKTLRRMSDANYLTAVKAASSRGWRRQEPVPLGIPEQPCMLSRLMESKASMPIRLALPSQVVEALATAIAAP
jgi:Zn-dependent peptidase ImmA (M78 family)/transcriptional regulator with XRE-family HTH domain